MVKVIVKESVKTRKDPSDNFTQLCVTCFPKGLNSTDCFELIHSWPCWLFWFGLIKINLQSRYCIRTLPREGMYWVVHPRRPKDFPRPERCPEGRGKSRGRRGCTLYNSMHPDSRQCTTIL